MLIEGSIADKGVEDPCRGMQYVAANDCDIADVQYVAAGDCAVVTNVVVVPWPCTV